MHEVNDLSTRADHRSQIILSKLTDLQQETSYGPDKAEDADRPHTLGSRVL
jgi:hypothetical protein